MTCGEDDTACQSDVLYLDPCSGPFQCLEMRCEYTVNGVPPLSTFEGEGLGDCDYRDHETGGKAYCLNTVDLLGNCNETGSYCIHGECRQINDAGLHKCIPFE